MGQRTPFRVGAPSTSQRLRNQEPKGCTESHRRGQSGGETPACDAERNARRLRSLLERTPLRNGLCANLATIWTSVLFAMHRIVPLPLPGAMAADLLPIPAPPVPRAAVELAAKLGEIDDAVERGLAILRARLLAGPSTDPATSARVMLDHAHDGAGGCMNWLLLERLDEAEISGSAPAIASARTYARFLGARCADPRERAAIEAISAPEGTDAAAARADWLRALASHPQSDAIARATDRRDRCSDPALAIAWAIRVLLLVARTPGGDAIEAARSLEGFAHKANAAAPLRFAREILSSLGDRSSLRHTPASASVAHTPSARSNAVETPLPAFLPAGPEPTEDDTDAMFERAAQATSAGAWHEASLWLERAARRVRDPAKRAAHYFELGRIAADELSNPSSALENFLVSFICSAEARTLERLEVLYRRGGRFRELAGAYDIAIEERRSAADNAGLEDVLLRKAQLEALELARPERAARTLIEAIRLNPGDRYALDLFLGALADKVDRALVVEAVRLHRAALPESAPTSPDLVPWL